MGRVISELSLTGGKKREDPEGLEDINHENVFDSQERKVDTVDNVKQEENDDEGV